jgi:cold shock CspA family protein
MRGLGVLAVTLLVVLAPVGVSAQMPMEHKGTISKIDTKAKTFAVKDEKGKEVMVHAEDVKALADLRVGDRVVVKVTTKDGKSVAKEVLKDAARRAPAPAYGK